MSYYNPKEIVVYVKGVAKDKAQMPVKKVFMSAILGGAYIAVGSFLAIMIGGNLPDLQATNPGLQKFIFGAVFPLGLILIAIAGADLFTGNTAYFIPSVMEKSIKIKVPLKNWLIVYFGNMVGAILVAWLFAYYTDAFKDSPAADFAVHLGEKKVSASFLKALVKGIFCNWMVALAMWLSFGAKDIAGKMMGLWFPIMAFVAMGFEHSIANMFFIPTAMFYGADVSVYQFIFKNLIPVTIGNIIGGAIFVGLMYAYLYSSKTKK